MVLKQQVPASCQQLLECITIREYFRFISRLFLVSGSYGCIFLLKRFHDRIHSNVLNGLGLKVLAKVENHHNFAWKDTLNDGREVIVHRKGATPAHEGELGIIPGSMTAPAYLVRGLGAEGSLNSAAHGAGRAMSRQHAKNSMTVSTMKQLLSKAGVTLLGGNVDENSQAYKDIQKVMQAQQSLVSTEGVFYPRIVRMSKD